jgi:hypothetical protein
MNEAAANISWLPFDPRDWEQLTPAFGRLRSKVGTHGPKLIANNRAAAFFDRCVHEGLLELALVAPDFTYRLFDVAERQKLTIRVPLNYEEGCSIEPYYEGDWYARRSDREKLTAIPVTPATAADRQPQQPPSATQPKRKPKRKLERKPRRKAGPGRERIYNHEAITGAGNRVLARGRPDTKALFFEKVIAECRAAKSKIKLPSNIDVDDSLLRRVVGKLYDDGSTTT